MARLLASPHTTARSCAAPGRRGDDSRYLEWLEAAKAPSAPSSPELTAGFTAEAAHDLPLHRLRIRIVTFLVVRRTTMLGRHQQAAPRIGAAEAIPAAHTSSAAAHDQVRPRNPLVMFLNLCAASPWRVDPALAIPPQKLPPKARAAVIRYYGTAGSLSARIRASARLRPTRTLNDLLGLGKGTCVVFSV